MQATRDDDLKDSFYLYIMRSSIGAGLKSQYTPNGHMPDRLAELMKELEEADSHRAEGHEEERHPKPARRHVRKN
jgi:hypothetical protein